MNHEGFTKGAEFESDGILAARTLRREERSYPALDAHVVLEARRGEGLGSIRRHITRNGVPQRT